MKNLKMIKNIYLLLIVCSILVGAVLLIWPQMGVSVMCKVYGVFLLIYGLGKLSGYFTGDLFQLAFQYRTGYCFPDPWICSVIKNRAHCRIPGRVHRNFHAGGCCLKDPDCN